MIGTVMMSNTSSTQSQQQQQGTTAAVSSIMKQQQQAYRQYDAAAVSDTDMSERGTIRSYRSSNTARLRSHPSQPSNASVISFDQASIATTATITNNHHRSHRSGSGNHRSQQQQQQPQQQRTSSRHRSAIVNKDVNSGINVNDEDPLTTAVNSNNETIQVQIISQDDANWANTTAFTGATSEVSADFNADDNFTEDGRSRKIDFNTAAETGQKMSLKTCCSRYFGFSITILILLLTYVTPILFIILPRLNLQFIPSLASWQIVECGIECEGLLIGISFKLFLVLLGVWALYLRKPKATLPRIYELRALILFLLCILTFSYWLFYGVRIIDAKQPDYYKILQFTVTYVDVLLFVYIISVFIMEIRQIQPQYVVRIVRSPDGIQKEFTIGKMSIQRAAVWLLEQYYKEYPVYNPWLENAHKKRIDIDAAMKTIDETSSQKSGSGGLKHYNIDSNAPTDKAGSKAKSQLLAITSRSHNDRFYEEYEYERRLRKRRARLLTATEDAFTHIKRANGQQPTTPSSVMDPFEAAQAVFTSIARDLRRYLRITRQQPYFTRDTIISHLADCISYDMSPKSFLQRYFNSEPIIFNHRALQSNGALPPPPPAASNSLTQRTKFKTPEQSWILICDTVLYQNVEDNLMLVLKQNEISLMCTFKRLPYFNLIEDILDTKRNKFVLRMNSETSV